LRGQGGHVSFLKNTDPKSLKRRGSYHEKKNGIILSNPPQREASIGLTVIISKSVKLTLASKSDFSKEGK
jgi:hypothetical protein